MCYLAFNVNNGRYKYTFYIYWQFPLLVNNVYIKKKKKKGSGINN